MNCNNFLGQNSFDCINYINCHTFVKTSEFRYQLQYEKLEASFASVKVFIMLAQKYLLIGTKTGSSVGTCSQLALPCVFLPFLIW